MVTVKRELLSAFCGCGGLDLGFEQAGFSTALAYDRRPDAISSWNRNRKEKNAKVRDVSLLDLETLDKDYGGEFAPIGIIGGPPCQGFSIANRGGGSHDPRNSLVTVFFDLALKLNARNSLNFIVMENVPNIQGSRGGGVLHDAVKLLESRNFIVSFHVLDAADYGVPQRRKRLFLVAYNKNVLERNQPWSIPDTKSKKKTVRDAIEHFPTPTVFSRGLGSIKNEYHENHWCMAPKSPKFFDGTLVEGYCEKRSFKTLWWDQPSYTASYGNREVHIHPSGERRLSVYEAMTLQGFPKKFVLNGSMSSQITQVSEAVPPPLAKAIALSIKTALDD